jgi:hypothetical protein
LPVFLREPDIFVLRAFISATKQNNQLVAILTQINSVPRPKINLQLYRATAHGPVFPEIALLRTVNSGTDVSLTELVLQRIDPFPIRDSPHIGLVMEDFLGHA